VRTQTNLMLTMLIGGLWHGASWTFVVWGGLHGLLLIVERPFRSMLARLQPLPLRVLHVSSTFALVCIAWVFFRATTLADALAILGPMLGAPEGAKGLAIDPTDTTIVLGTVGSMLLLHFALRDVDLYASLDRVPWWLRSIALATMLLAIVTLAGEDRAFIYFQF
jgi:D-alanyl-lipoteichoic acid acyltransferase DltB (MBOAT superfamily)